MNSGGIPSLRLIDCYTQGFELGLKLQIKMLRSRETHGDACPDWREEGLVYPIVFLVELHMIAKGEGVYVGEVQVDTVHVPTDIYGIGHDWGLTWVRRELDSKGLDVTWFSREGHDHPWAYGWSTLPTILKLRGERARIYFWVDTSFLRHLLPLSGR